jgi:metal-dependent hydrolase (beta-lactamase superfamily II)
MTPLIPIKVSTDDTLVASAWDPQTKKVSRKEQICKASRQSWPQLLDRQANESGWCRKADSGYWLVHGFSTIVEAETRQLLVLAGATECTTHVLRIH